MERTWTSGTSAAALTGVLLIATPALGASIAGNVADPSGLALAGIEVRLWQVDQIAAPTKGYRVVATAVTDGAGDYALPTVAAGQYKLDARLQNAAGMFWTDRWYDVSPPLTGGWVQADADDLLLLPSDALTGINLTLEIGGMLQGQVTAGGTPRAGFLVRAELLADPRTHHNDVTMLRQSPFDPQTTTGGPDHAGWYYLRGLQPGDYRLIVHDPGAGYETTVVPGPIIVTGGVVTTANISMSGGMGIDQYEPNDAASQAVTPNPASIDVSVVRLTPPQPWISSTAYLGAGDVDFFCFEALQSDRLIAKVDTPFDVAGASRQSPWIDPVVSWWTADGSLVLDADGNPVVDDDRGRRPYGCLLDTGVTRQDRRHCLAVSLFDDLNFDGVGQSSPAGRYQLTIEMGNREPQISVLYNGGISAPAWPPTSISMEEGQTVGFEMFGADPDADPLTYGVGHLDNILAAVTDGVLDGTTTPATYGWTANTAAALGSPYYVVFWVSDGELPTSRFVKDSPPALFDPTYDAGDFPYAHWVRIDVAGPDDPPTEPVLAGALAAKCQGYVYTDQAPAAFPIGAAVDIEGVPLALQVQIYDGDLGTQTPPCTDQVDPADRCDPTFSDLCAVNQDCVGGVCAAPLYDVILPQDVTALMTYAWVDPALFLEDAHYRLRVRAYDGNCYSTWQACDFYINASNAPPGALDIRSPFTGDAYSYDHTSVEFVVGNASDPDGAADDVGIAYCVSASSSFDDCPADPADWSRVPQDGGTDTTFSIDDLPPGETIHVVMCAIDRQGECGERTSVSFSIEAPPAVGVGGGSGAGGAGGSPGRGCGCKAGDSAPEDGLPLLAAVWIVTAVRRRRRRDRC